MNLTLSSEKYSVACDMNCGNKSEFFIKDDAGNSYMHICSQCSEKIIDCLKKNKKSVKKA